MEIKFVESFKNESAEVEKDNKTEKKKAKPKTKPKTKAKTKSKSKRKSSAKIKNKPNWSVPKQKQYNSFSLADYTCYSCSFLAGFII